MRRLIAASLLGLCACALASAAEPTEPERLYQRLKETEKHTNKLLADRWNKLVRQRQWIDSTGKHKTYARYVDHDPNLQSVKLLVLVKNGDQQSYKEGTVPLARLSKNDQAAVKRIVILRKQVEAALADAPEGSSELAGGEGYRGESPVAETAGGELRSPEMATPPAATLPGVPAIDAWRTDFATFAANLSGPSGEDRALGWGDLHALKAVYEKERMLGMLEKLPAEQQPPLLMKIQLTFAYVAARAGLGEVAWQAALDGSAGVTPAGLTHNLQLPAPLTLVLIPDPDYAGDVSRFGRGEPVQFVGRFAELGGAGDAPQIKLVVRLPSDQRAPKPTPVPAPAATMPAPLSPVPEASAYVAPPPVPASLTAEDYAALIVELESWEDEGPPPRLAAKLQKAADAPGARAVVDEFAASAQVSLSPYDEVPWLLTFEIGEDAVKPLLEKHQSALLANGWYLFRLDRNFGLDRGDDMALLPTTDKYEVLATVGTNGANSDLMTADIIAWLRKMEQSDPFVLTDAGFDYLGGRFTRPVAHPEKLAKEMYDFCPDVVEEVDDEAVAVLVERFSQSNAELFLWWD